MGFLAFSTPSCPILFVYNPMCEILKKLDAVGVAVRCKPSRGCFATPALIPASKIGWRMPVDFDAHSFCVHLRPKSPKLNLVVIVGYIAYLANKAATTGEILAYRGLLSLVIILSFPFIALPSSF